jgi:hypothetical protein
LNNHLNLKHMKILSLLFSIFVVLTISFTACEETSTESCDSEDLSDDFGCPADIDATATFCSDGVNNSYYTYNGDKYECTGVAANTCDSALQQIEEKFIDKGCGSKKGGRLKMTQMAERLLEEVRENSLCRE